MQHVARTHHLSLVVHLSLLLHELSVMQADTHNRHAQYVRKELIITGKLKNVLCILYFRCDSVTVGAASFCLHAWFHVWFTFLYSFTYTLNYVLITGWVFLFVIYFSMLKRRYRNYVKVKECLHLLFIEWKCLYCQNLILNTDKSKVVLVKWIWMCSSVEQTEDGGGTDSWILVRTFF